MIVIRPVSQDDWSALWDMAHKTGPGFSSLQPQKDQVQKRLKHSLSSFSGEEKKEHALYLFVLEELVEKKIIGVCAIKAHLGLDEPWYVFRLNTVVHASQRFDIFHQVQTLTLCNDYTGCTELCTLFLLPEYRGVKGAGHLLAKSRLLFIASNERLFDERIIAEMRGYFNEKGDSPFWESLGRKFIGLDFIQADRALSCNRSFIIELMPRHAVYINMLPKEAQAVIGQPYTETIPAKKMLESEGFKYRNYVAPFDAGPVLEASVKDIRAISNSFLAKVSIDSVSISKQNENWLISNEKLSGFRCIMGPFSPEKGRVILPEEYANALRVHNGDMVRMVSQYPIKE